MKVVQKVIRVAVGGGEGKRMYFHVFLMVVAFASDRLDCLDKRTEVFHLLTMFDVASVALVECA